MNHQPQQYVVVAYLNKAQRIASVCGKGFTSVTYYLAIGKIALKIQTKESLKYDKVFVNLEACYI